MEEQGLRIITGCARSFSITALALGACLVLRAQVQPLQPQSPTQTPSATQALPPGTERLRPNYVLGPGDQILIRASEMEELGDRPYRIEPDGFIDLPTLGKTKAGGLTVDQLQTNLVEALRPFVRQPQVTITVVQFRSDPVFFVGAFKTPGIYPLQGARTLVEMLSAIGGLLPNASRRIKLTRRTEFGAIPLPGAVKSPDGTVSSVTISLASLRENINPAEDIVLMPFDVISVERAELIYVNGEVGHVGAFELDERDSMSLVQVLTLAGGLGHEANPTQAIVLRPVSNTSQRAQIPLNITRVLAGKDDDFPLLPNDLLYVPREHGFKRNIGRVLLIAIPVALSLGIALAVYH
ncbi:MAG: polysaccharide biosynthesis/export family protein [Bryobacteraceae bacterium]|jgi:polysaccharide biosynthesis/export protein